MGSKSGMDLQNTKYGKVRTAKVWNRRYERGPIRIDSILSVYARMAPQERAVHIGWIDVVSDLELLRSRTTMPGRMGDLALRRRPGENPVLHSVDSTKRS